jgi:hypothetical protein
MKAGRAIRALRKVIAGRIEFRPEERDGARGYRLRWSVVPGAFMNGNIAGASPGDSKLMRVT